MKDQRVERSMRSLAGNCRSGAASTCFLLVLRCFVLLVFLRFDIVVPSQGPIDPEFTLGKGRLGRSNDEFNGLAAGTIVSIRIHSYLFSITWSRSIQRSLLYYLPHFWLRIFSMLPWRLLPLSYCHALKIFQGPGPIIFSFLMQ